MLYFYKPDESILKVKDTKYIVLSVYHHLNLFDSMQTRDVIKQNESELANTVFKIQPNKVDSFYCLLLFVQSFNCSYLWNQMPNLCGVFTKSKPKQYPNRKCQKTKNIFSTSDSISLIATHILSTIEKIDIQEVKGRIVLFQRMAGE